MNWLKRLLSEQNGEPSSRRLLFALVVICVLAYLGWHLFKHGLDTVWADVARVLVGTTGGAVAVGRFAENNNKPE